MMNYLIFLVKKVYKNKMNWVPLGILLIAVIWTLFLNNSTSQQINLKSQIQDNIALNASAIEAGTEEMKNLDKNSDDYRLLEMNINESKILIEQDKEFLKNYQDEKWGSVYQQQVINIEKAIQSEQWNNPDSIFINTLNRDLMLYQNLAKTSIPFENVDFPTTGIQYMLSMFMYIFPILLTIGIIFTLSNLYGSFYYDKINKNKLLPQSKLKILMFNIISGVIISEIVLIFITAFSFILASVCFGTGSTNYPILTYNLVTQEMSFEPIKLFILPTIILHILGIFFIVSFVYLIASLCKDKLMTLFISILSLVGGLLLTMVIQPLQTIAHYIPMTYFKSFEIATGVFQESIDNYHISFNLGIIVLLVSIIICNLIVLVQNIKA